MLSRIYGETITKSRSHNLYRCIDERIKLPVDHDQKLFSWSGKKRYNKNMKKIPVLSSALCQATSFETVKTED